MISKKNLTPIVLASIFFLMLGLSFAAVPLYDLFCRVTGFGGTTQISKEAPKIVIALFAALSVIGIPFAADIYEVIALPLN